MTHMKLLAAAAVLTLAAGSAFAASPTDPATAQPAPAMSAQTDPNIGGPVYQPNVAAYPGETAHVIGGQTFYYGGDASGSVGSDGSND